MQILHPKDLEALFDLGILQDLISVDPAFENAAKALLQTRSISLSPPTRAPKETPNYNSHLPLEKQHSPSQKVTLPKEHTKNAPVEPIAEPVIEKKREVAAFSSTTIALSQRGYDNLHFDEKIPDDKAARIIKQQYLWKYPDTKVLLLTFTQDDQEKLLWKRLTEALCNLRCKSICIDALTIDHAAKWNCLFDNTFSLVLAPIPTLLRVPALTSSYTFTPHTKEHHLFDIPVFPLKPGHQYLQHPDLKKELWTHLCKMLGLQK